MKALILYAPHPKEGIGFVAIDSVFEPFWNLGLLFTERYFEPIPSESCRLSSEIMRIHPHILDFITQRGDALFSPELIIRTGIGENGGIGSENLTAPHFKFYIFIMKTTVNQILKQIFAPSYSLTN